MTDEPDEEGWYWDLLNERAVPAAERGFADHMLGPYPTKAAAENWKATSEARNEAWDDADEAWNAWDGEQGADGGD